MLIGLLAASAGAWTLRCDRIRPKQRKPFFAPFADGAAAPRGESRTDRAVTGQPVAVSVGPGDPDPPSAR